jgi:hypothetical protein
VASRFVRRSGRTPPLVRGVVRRDVRPETLVAQAEINGLLRKARVSETRARRR